MIAGPSVLATLLVLVSAHPEQMGRWLAALLVPGASRRPFFFARLPLPVCSKKRGSMAVERLMGMLLVMVAVQMLLNGIEYYLKR